MSRPKGDPAIGERAAEEVQRRADEDGTSILAVCETMHVDNHLFYRWRYGTTPDTATLAAMAAHGLDVFYILTGRRSV